MREYPRVRRRGIRASSFIAALAAVTVATLTGCRGLPAYQVDLSPAQVETLRARSRPAEELGVRLGSPGAGALTLENVIEVPEDLRAYVRFERLGNGENPIPAVRVRINQRTLLAIVDTGAAFSVIKYGAAASAGVVPLGPAGLSLRAQTFQGTAVPILAIAEEVGIGGATFRRVPFGVLNRIPGLPILEPSHAHRVEAVIGQDLLGRCTAVTFEGSASWGQANAGGDGRSGGLTLYGTSPAVDGRRVMGVIKLRPASQGAVAFSGSINGRPPVEVRFDSGGSFGLWVPQPIALRLELRDAVPTAAWRSTHPVDRRWNTHQIRPTALRAERFLADILPTYVGWPREGGALPEFALLGNEILRKHSVHIDYRNGKLFFLAPPLPVQ